MLLEQVGAARRAGADPRPAASRSTRSAGDRRGARRAWSTATPGRVAVARRARPASIAVRARSADVVVVCDGRRASRAVDLGRPPAGGRAGHGLHPHRRLAPDRRLAGAPSTDLGGAAEARAAPRRRRAVAYSAELLGVAPAGARPVRRVRQGPGAVRPADRQLPGGEAPLRRHARRRRGHAVGRLLGRLVRRPTGDPDASVAASTAKMLVLRRGHAGSWHRRLQVHGGIGFTWEHDLHLFLKRAQLDAISFGDATYHRDPPRPPPPRQGRSRPVGHLDADGELGGEAAVDRAGHGGRAGGLPPSSLKTMSEVSEVWRQVATLCS